MLEMEIMETLSNLESFVRSAESASFSAAARQLALTPAAVSRNVASQKLLPAKTRTLVDFIAAAFRDGGLAQRFSAA
jgi:DNA-binding transcriptional regulator YdaS (Cro superfamily)